MLAAGCTRRADVHGAYCASLNTTACARDLRCEVHPACCGGGSICVPAGSVFAPCPSCPSDCGGLTESQCKSNPSCRADYCSQCQCTPSFVRCADAGSEPIVCTALPCPALFCSCEGLDGERRQRTVVMAVL